MADVVDIMERVGIDPKLTPDVILPSQFLAGARRDSETSAEKALMLAVLEDGIRCFQKYFTSTHSQSQLLARQAEEWIQRDDWDWPFSFNNVCEALGIDPEALRSSLLAWKERRSGKHSTGEPKDPARIYHLHMRMRPRHRPL